MGGAWDFLAVLAAVLLPPLGVFMKKECGCEFWISVLLTILGYIPGLVYALYVVVTSVKTSESGVVTSGGYTGVAAGP